MRNRFLLGCGIAALLFTGVAGLALGVGRENPVLQGVEASYASLPGLFLKPLDSWEQALGPAIGVEVAGYQGFFYWPDRGMAVYLHPHYEAQHRKQRDIRQRQVTSVYLSQTRDLSLEAIGLPSGETVRFSQLPQVSLRDKTISPTTSWQPIKDLFWFHQEEDDRLRLRNNPIPGMARTATNVYTRHGAVVAIEIREAFVLSHYD